MAADRQIRVKIEEKIKQLPEERLNEVLEFLLELEEKEKRIEDILSFAGVWKDKDQEFIDDLTVNLHKNRMGNENRCYNS